MAAAGKRYRVVQWATGNVGSRSLRHIINHPDMVLAGVYVHPPASRRPTAWRTFWR